MRTLAAWLFVCVALPAHADLYRWIDPETGTVKISSYPPADPRVNAEIVRYTGSAPQPGPAAAAATPAAPASPLAELETRWRAALGQLAGVSPQDFNKGSDGLRQHFEAYEAVRTELDRVDPTGAARRRAEAAPVFERLRQGLAAQLRPPKPGAK